MKIASRQWLLTAVGARNGAAQRGHALARSWRGPDAGWSRGGGGRPNPAVGAVDACLSPDGHLLYVDENAAGAVAEFAVHGCSLTLLAGSPASLPGGAAPAGIAVT